MGHTFTHLLTHIIFSTKGRVPYLRVEARDDVFAYMGGIIREIGGAALIIGGTVDHVHLLTKLRASIALADVLEVVKTNSSRWIDKQCYIRSLAGNRVMRRSVSATRMQKECVNTSPTRSNITERFRFRKNWSPFGTNTTSDTIHVTSANEASSAPAALKISQS